ncbi:hypothetical protein W02_19080 [Nitrospira sp. KM1]|uniref:hypothetical protein n=1 Tax=Nitrospira sp. KM1 TaxID=1936990 RepID=UPI0013A7989E|nr:hypothetical protein [Nitrospira sp. KM1]BCA54768.1 hypothetical protein W02_19080 [Nitrospira sp. KM1]
MNSDYPELVDWECEAQAAMTAAEQGMWDRVRAYYDLREARLHAALDNADLAKRVVEIDRTIAAMVQTAQAALRQSLAEVATTRKTMGQLRGALVPETHNTMLSQRL